MKKLFIIIFAAWLTSVTYAVDLIELEINGRLHQQLSIEELELLSSKEPSGAGWKNILYVKYLFPVFKDIISCEIVTDRGSFILNNLSGFENWVFRKVDNTWVLDQGLQVVINPQVIKINTSDVLNYDKSIRIWVKPRSLDSVLIQAIRFYQDFNKLQIQIEEIEEPDKMYSQRYLSNGPLPDLVLLNPIEMRTMIQYLDPIPEIDLSRLSHANLFEAYLQAYAAPFRVAIPIVIYNRTNGITISKQNISTLIEASKSHASEILIDDNNLSILTGIMQSFINDIKYDLNSIIIFNRAPYLRALSYIQEQSSKGIISNGINSWNKFAINQANFLLSYSYRLQDIKFLKFDVGVEALSYNDLNENALTNIIRANAWAVPKRATNRQQVLQLISYLSSYGFQQKIILDRGLFPSNTDVFPLYQGTKYYHLLNTSVQNTKFNFFTYQVNELFVDKYQHLLDGSLSPQNILAEVDQQIRTN